jgi:hypothetical protein
MPCTHLERLVGGGEGRLQDVEEEEETNVKDEEDEGNPVVAPDEPGEVVEVEAKVEVEVEVEIEVEVEDEGDDEEEAEEAVEAAAAAVAEEEENREGGERCCVISDVGAMGQPKGGREDRGRGGPR